MPPHFLRGNRNEQILHARLRLNCSSFNHTFYMKDIVASPICVCGLQEIDEHFFLLCPNYREERNHLIDRLTLLPKVDINILLFGANYLGFDTKI